MVRAVEFVMGVTEGWHSSLSCSCKSSISGYYGCACVHMQCAWAMNFLVGAGRPPVCHLHRWDNRLETTNLVQQWDWLNWWPSQQHLANWCRNSPGGNLRLSWRSHRQLLLCLCWFVLFMCRLRTRRCHGDSPGSSCSRTDQVAPN